jgi:hypothetical protein
MSLLSAYDDVYNQGAGRSIFSKNAAYIAEYIIFPFG